MNEKRLFLGPLIYLMAAQAMAQIALSGKVMDAQTREPLIGAAILVKGTASGAITDPDGEFALGYKNGFPLTLVISYLGYESREIVLLAPEWQEVYLSQASASLNEVTVTARRRNEEIQEIPLAIAVIGARELDNST